MKQAYNATLSEIIQYDVVSGAVSYPVIKTEWSKDSITWTEFADVESRSITLSNENDRYQAYSFMPPSKSLSLQLNNFNQLYSTGSGNPEASILEKNLLVRCWSGYQLTAAYDSTVSDDFSSNNKFVHTQLTASGIYSDISSFVGTFATAAQLGVTYDSTTYDATTYGYFGYYTKRFDCGNRDVEIKTLNINVSSNKFSARYRTGNFPALASAPWSSFYSLATGANSLTVGVQDARYCEMIVRFEADTWSDTSHINSASVLYDSEIQLFKQGTFIIDEPKYAEKVSISGRDYLKKALETEISVPTLSSMNIGDAFTQIFDRANIPYATASWSVTATTVSLNGTLSESLQGVSAWKALDMLMDALNAGNDDWVFRFNEDGNAELKKIEVASEADWTAHYFYNIEKVAKSFDSDKQLQRITVVNKDFVVNAETLLKNVTGTASSSLTITFPDAIYLRYTDTNDVIVSETARENDSITFATNTGESYDISVYGCTPKNAITDEVWSERGSSTLVKKSEGNTFKKTNPFLDQSKCDALAGYMIDKYNDPRKRIEFEMVANPLLELNDNILVFDKFTFTDDIYVIEEIQENWSNPALKHTIICRDSGVDLGEFIWDRNGHVAGINDLKYDTGLVWDMDLSINVTSDSTDYSYLKQVRFS